MTDALDEEWWHWNWDRMEATNVRMPFSLIVRWRRGWVTLYKMVQRLPGMTTTEWKLWLPFNIWIGIQLTKKDK